LSTKINIGVDALGNPVRFILTAGQVHDIRQAKDLISGISFDNLLADMAMTPMLSAVKLLRSTLRP
jgi:transposase